MGPAGCLQSGRLSAHPMQASASGRAFEWLVRARPVVANWLIRGLGILLLRQVRSVSLEVDRARLDMQSGR